MGSAFHQLCPRYSGTLTPNAPTAIRLWDTFTFTLSKKYVIQCKVYTDEGDNGTLQEVNAYKVPAMHITDSIHTNKQTKNDKMTKRY